MIIVGIQVGLVFRNKNRLQRRKLAHLLCMEVCRFVEHQSVAVAEDVGREPSGKSQATCADNRSKTRLHQRLSRLEVFSCNRHLGLFGHFPHRRNVYGGVRSTHDERRAFRQGRIRIAHGRSDMLAVVCLHRLFQGFQCSVHFFAYRHIDFSRRSPQHHDTAAPVFSLETADIFTQLFHHVPARSTVFHIVSVQTLRIVMVESGLHGNNLFQLILDRINIFLLQYLAIDCRLISVGRIYIPRSEYDVAQFSHRNNLIVMKILLFSTTPHTNPVVLSHGSYRFGKPFTDHQHTGHKRGSHSSKPHTQNSQFAFSRFYIHFFHSFFIFK